MKGETLVALARGIAPVVRDYVVKSHGELQAQIDQLQIAERLIAELVKANADLKSRVDFLEARPVAIGLRYRKTWQPDTPYDAGDVVTCAGSGWVCDQATTTKPGASKDWTLFVKRGRDGKDGGPT